MDQLGFLPSSQVASHHDPCQPAALDAPYSDLDDAYANWPLQLWLESVSIAPGGTSSESQDLYTWSCGHAPRSPPPVIPSHLGCSSANATAATNPSPVLLGLPYQPIPKPASQPINLKTGSDADSEPASYAKLIYSALLSAPGHKLPLQGIYRWFMENTTKHKVSTGWQSSVRYNLSKNPGFSMPTRRPPCERGLKRANATNIRSLANNLSTASSRPRLRKCSSLPRVSPQRLDQYRIGVRQVEPGAAGEV
ncbi:hypothetical protein BJY01DRAFT_16377 [Aspergillus pseudoustus]|uniref:Fork-head domain-containing protein n=1 Tax=Aspergillus pseudoustus TaxID=1810923 RepID=A0ABR4JLC3_9EURO